MDHVSDKLPRVNGLVLRYAWQTARVVEVGSGTTKAELRGHDNVVEAAIFVPRASVAALRELTGQKVGSSSFLSTHSYLTHSCV